MRRASCFLFITLAFVAVTATPSLASGEGLDTTFGSGGMAHGNFGSAAGGANAIARQADGKVVAAGFNGYGNGFLLARFNVDGTLDGSFGSGGRQTTAFRRGTERPAAVFIQSDGKIVVVGDDDGGDIVAARYGTSGELDPSFGDGGRAIVHLDSRVVVYGAVRLADDKLVISGDRSAGHHLFVARILASGSLDTSFGDAGVASVDAMDAGPVALAPDGKLVSVARASANSTTVRATRINADGSLDTSFGTNGVTSFTTPQIGIGVATVAVQGDGKILAGADGSHGILIRLAVDGTLDSTFSGDGIADTPTPPNAIAVQPDGKIVLACGSELSSVDRFDVSRFNTDGSPDSSFAGDGTQTTTGLPGNAHAYAIALSPDGKITAAGGMVRGGRTSINRPPVGGFALTRYGSDGTPDGSFGAAGAVAIDPFAGSNTITDVVALPSGKLLAALTAGDQMGVARFNADGSADSSYGSGGAALAIGTAISRRVAVQGDGKALVVGARTTSSYLAQILVSRFNVDGTPDQSFGDHGTVIVGSGGYVGTAVVVAPTGKIYIGSSSIFIAPAFTVHALNADGTPDTSFSGDGEVTTDFPDLGNEAVSQLAVMADGDVLAVGGSIFDEPIAIARYLPTGALDTSFSGDGLITTPGGHAIPAGLQTRADGRFAVAAGNTVVSYAADGTVQTQYRFGPAVQRSAMAWAANGRLLVAGAAVTPDVLTTGVAPFGLASFDADGTADLDFGSSGVITAPFAGAATGVAAMAITGPGRVVVAGSAVYPHTVDYALAKFQVGDLGDITTPPDDGGGNDNGNNGGDGTGNGGGGQSGGTAGGGGTDSSGGGTPQSGTTGGGSTPKPPVVKPAAKKPLSAAQKRAQAKAKALKACKKLKATKKRAACVKAVNKKYAPKPKKKKTKTPAKKR